MRHCLRYLDSSCNMPYFVVSRSRLQCWLNAWSCTYNNVRNWHTFNKYSTPSDQYWSGMVAKKLFWRYYVLSSVMIHLENDEWKAVLQWKASYLRPLLNVLLAKSVSVLICRQCFLYPNLQQTCVEWSTIFYTKLGKYFKTFTESFMSPKYFHTRLRRLLKLL